MAEPDHIRAHAASIRHRDQILESNLCGCFYCLEFFAPGDVKDWIDEPNAGQTALCPRCGIDSVIGSASGFPISRAFLKTMNQYWFQKTTSIA
jgi:hypothetical protein